MPLHRHLSDTAEVAGLLWDHWLPVAVKATMTGSLGPQEGRAFFVWLAACHDLGKASPAFQVKVESLAASVERHGLSCASVSRRLLSPHNNVSQVIVREWLMYVHGFSVDAADAVAIVAGGHHGNAPERQSIVDAAAVLQRGGPAWVAAQMELADWVGSNTEVDLMMKLLRSKPPTVQAQVLLTAAVIMADWIASDSENFPYQDRRSSPQRATEAWKAIRLTPAWRPGALGDLAAAFADRFDLPVGSELRPVQRAAVEAARDMEAPGLMIVEAPMGEGKTEGALLAAEVLAFRFDKGGCLIALPTMATSDAMFSRVHDWVKHIATEDVSLFLAHGKAALNPEFQKIARLGRVRDVDDGCGRGAAVALEWLSGRKKGVLSNFVVGTVDQVLLGALKSRHLALRHLAVAGKVVVIDEVHGADAYMSVYLERVLHWLAAYEVPTILLSATLPSSRRTSFVDAYRSGTSEGRAAVAAAIAGFSLFNRRRPADAESQLAPMFVAVEKPLEEPVYPLISVATGGSCRSIAVEGSGRQSEVEIVLQDDHDDLLIRLLTEAGRAGGVIAVVRNTVDRAQQTAKLLREYFPPEDVLLMHSRFLAGDRMKREQALRDEFGPPSSGARLGRTRVVVGTQVLEQSLDVDFDLLVTDLAPMDLILQRMGRVHRHQRPAAERGAMVDPRCVVVGVQDWAAEPPIPDRGSSFVYGDAALLRSAAVLQGHLRDRDSIRLPDDIAPLVEKAYAAGLEVPSAWCEAFGAAEGEAAIKAQIRQEDAATFVLDPVPSTLFGWTAAGVGDGEDAHGQARVRDGDDTFEVLVAQLVDGETRLLPWIDEFGGAVLSTEGAPRPALARALATCALRLPARLCSPWLSPKVIRDLEGAVHAAWQESPWLRGELILFLDENFSAEVGGVLLSYSREGGLVADYSR